MKRRPFALFLFFVPAFCLSLACDDPEKTLREHYAKMQLNPIIPPRDDIEPGHVFLFDKKRKKPSPADTVFDYTKGGVTSYAILNKDAIRKFNAIFSSFQQKKTVKPALALALLDQILPVSISGSVEFTSEVMISPVNARAKSITIAEIREFLESSNSDAFHDQMATFQANNKHLNVSIAKTVYTTNKMRVVAETGKDVASGLKKGKLGKVESGEISIKYEKKTKRELVIEGNIFFAFAASAVLIKKDSGSSRYKIVAPPGFTFRDRVKDKRQLDEDVYSYSVVGEDFQPLKFVPLSELGL